MEHFTFGITRVDAKYLVRAESALGEAGPNVIDSAVIADAAVNGQHLISGRTNHSRVQDIGRKLFDALCQGDIAKLYQQTAAVAQRNGSAMPIVFKFKQSPELQEPVWEFLHDGEKFLALDPATPIVRYVEQTRPIQDLGVKPPLRMLLTTGAPRGYETLDLAQEERNVREALAGLDDRIQLVVERNISLETLRHTLTRALHTERPFHIWHHCGHGARRQHNKFFVLILQDRDGSAQPIEVDRLSTLLRAFPDLRVATLNVCHGGSVYGLAPALAALNLPAVVGFRGSVLDETALQFAKAFYPGLLRTSAAAAMSQARVALALQQRYALDWALPLLFLRTTNPFLLLQPKDKPSVGKKHGSNIQFEIDQLSAKNITNIGALHVGAPHTDEPSAETTKFKLGSVESENVTQIGQVNISDEEAAKQFDLLRQIARSISGFDSDR
ncbi:MAG: CHAT domain-containing protein [Chloroflexi bacterium]|nr:CHAT domain-containing protein [Chloroflexota bacterium]